MKRAIIGSLAAIVLLSGTSFAFNGQRRGFVLGGGAGIAATSKWKVEVPIWNATVGVDESAAGVAFQFIIGGAFDDNNMLVYEGNAAMYNSDFFDESVGQAFNGAAWYHYFGAVGKSAFSTVGLGLQYFKVGDFDATDPGIALLLGGGYEFARHWQAGVYISFGKTKDAGVDFEHSHLSFIVSGIAF
ncbi:MAG: hypothetical protein AB1644_04005 [Candidatus Zixiibacteriota bacterium]